MKIPKGTTLLSLVLAAALCASVAINIVQYVIANNNGPPEERFIFSFDAPKIKNGTLTIDVTMRWEAERLLMKVVVDDDSGGLFLGLAFDTNGDYICIGEPAFGLTVNNLARWGAAAFVVGSGDLGGAWVSPRISPFHNCTFTEGVGYTFDIALPRTNMPKFVPSEPEMVLNPPVLIHLVYKSLDPSKPLSTGFVWVEFTG